MIHHVVFFKFKDSTTEQDIEKLEDGLGALPGKVPQIRRYEMGRDIARSERSFDFALESSFDDMDSLSRYIAHPEHQKVLKHVNEICSSIKSVDFETNKDE